MYKVNDKKENFISLSFYVLNLFSFLYLFFDFLRPGVFASLFMIVLFVLNIRYIKILSKDINSLYTIFTLICLLSGFSYILTGSGNASLYFYGISYNIMPMVMFFIGAISAKKGNRIIIENLIISNFIIVAIGIILYYFEPSFYRVGYVSKLIDLGVVTGTYYRFPSYVSSLAVGNLTVISIPLLFMMRNSFSKQSFFIFLGFFIFGSILTMQRSSFVMLIFVLLISFVEQIRKKNSFKKCMKNFIGLIIISFFLLLIYENIFTETQRLIFDRRVSSLSSAIGERSGQWESGIEVVSNYPLGLGIGSLGHKAVIVGVKGAVPDGNYFRILAEVGIHGLFIFLILNCLVIFRAAKRNKHLFLALLVYLFQAIGTNVFDIYYISFIYWFILGYSANYTHIKNKLPDNNY